MTLTATPRRPTPSFPPTPDTLSEPDVPAASLGSQPATDSGTPDVILVKSGYRQVATRVREIVYVEASRNYVQLHLQNRVVLKSRIPIDVLARHLGDAHFLRIHRSRLVGIEHVRSVGSLAGGRLALMLSDGSRVVVARDRRRMVLARLGALPRGAS